MTRSLIAAAHTVQGPRDHQEDRFRLDRFDLRSSSYALLTVADGMGGHGNGDVAAETAIEAFPDAVLRAAEKPKAVPDVLAAAVKATQAAVTRQAAGGGSTLSTVLLRLSGPQPRAWIAWVGDSPVMLLRRTRSASRFEPVVRAHPHGVANWLDRCLGGPDANARTSTPDFLQADLRAGDLILVASDGLDPLVGYDRRDEARGVQDPLPGTCQQLAKLLPEGSATDAARLQMICGILCSDALDRAGKRGDNTTIILGSVS